MNSIADAYRLPPSELVLILVRLGWTQEQIALEAGTGQATICHILSGKRKHPRYTTVVKLRDLVLRLNDLAPSGGV